MAYRDGSKANPNLPMEEQFEYYYFTKNLQGDIIIVMSDNGIAVAAYSEWKRTKWITLSFW